MPLRPRPIGHSADNYLLLAITHNVMILLRWVIEVFYGAGMSLFFLLFSTAMTAPATVAATALFWNNPAHDAVMRLTTRIAYNHLP